MAEPPITSRTATSMVTLSTNHREVLLRHKGLLRDENIILGQLFGYDDPYEDILGPYLRCRATNLPGSTIKDVLLIAIDIDTFQGYEQVVADQQIHIGASLFDSRSLQASGAASQADSDLNSIKSVQSTTSEDPYCRKAANRFLFGQPGLVKISEVKPRLERMVSGRDAVLILHGGKEDLKMLENLGIDLHAIFVIDTLKAAQYPLKLTYRYSLEKLLVALDIPFANLHAAGNDAHFALRALLMIVVKEAECQTGTPFIASLCKTLTSIALAPRPPSAGELPAPYLEAWQKANVESRKRRKAKREAKLERNALRRLERQNPVIDLADSPDGMEKGRC